MRRREFVAAIGGALTASFVRAQQAGRVYRVGWLGGGTRPVVAPFVAELEQGLRDRGYVIGRDVAIELGLAEGRLERLPDVARELARTNVDAIVVGTNSQIAAAKAATQTIPIVFAIGTDVVGAGFAKSLARPGGNITGLTWDVGGDTVVKRVELLKEIAPRVSRVAFLWEPPYRDQYKIVTDRAAPVLRVDTSWFEYSGNLERDFAEMMHWRADAVFVLTAGSQYASRAEFAALASKHRVPTAFSVSEPVDAGGLLSYGPNLAAAFRYVARYVDRILKGAKPSDLPIEQPSKIDLTINLKTAKQLGLTVSHSLLLRADRVIE